MERFYFLLYLFIFILFFFLMRIRHVRNEKEPGRVPSSGHNKMTKSYFVLSDGPTNHCEIRLVSVFHSFLKKLIQYKQIDN